MILINELYACSALNSNWNIDSNRLNVNGNNNGNNRNGYAFGIALVFKTFSMKTYNNLYAEIISEKNLYLAYKKAKKGKSSKPYVMEFCRNLKQNIDELRIELCLHSYKPRPLNNFILRDPKTRKISKSDFRDRVIHHALCNIIEPIFDKIFIYDSYANRKGKGSLAALQRFDIFKRKISGNGKLNGWFNNNQVKGYCFKADIKHYFEEIDHEILLNLIRKKIKCNKTIWLIKKILENYENKFRPQKGMPLGNLTSQFFANIYLNELDKFVKHKLKVQYYIRYVDDFVILHYSKKQLYDWKEAVDNYLKSELKIELHKDKSMVVSLGRVVSFVGFRVFYHYKLLKKFNRRNIPCRLAKFHELFLEKRMNYDKIYESMQGSFAYMHHANTYWLRNKLVNQIEERFPNEVSYIGANQHLRCLKILNKIMWKSCKNSKSKDL